MLLGKEPVAKKLGVIPDVDRHFSVFEIYNPHLRSVGTIGEHVEFAADIFRKVKLQFRKSLEMRVMFLQFVEIAKCNPDAALHFGGYGRHCPLGIVLAGSFKHGVRFGALRRRGRLRFWRQPLSKYDGAGTARFSRVAGPKPRLGRREKRVFVVALGHAVTPY